MHCAEALELSAVRKEGWIFLDATLRSVLLDMQLRYKERYTNY